MFYLTWFFFKELFLEFLFLICLKNRQSCIEDWVTLESKISKENVYKGRGGEEIKIIMLTYRIIKALNFNVEVSERASFIILKFKLLINFI